MGSKHASWEELACESLCSGTLSSTRFSMNSSKPFRYVGISQVSPFLIVVFVFYLILDFWLAWPTGLSVLAFRHVYLTQLRRIGIYPTQVSPCSSNHTVAWHSWRCHGWWGRRAWERRRRMIISCLEGVMDVEEGKFEEELVDKPGTTIGNEVLCVALYPNTVFNEMWFLTVDPCIRVSVFKAIELLAYHPWGVSLSRFFPILWHKL